VAAGLSASGELVWLYQGSHNCSGAAWGKRQMDAHGTWESLFMSYELGVLFIPPSPLPAAAARRIVPWCSPAKYYGPGSVAMLRESRTRTSYRHTTRRPRHGALLRGRHRRRHERDRALQGGGGGGRGRSSRGGALLRRGAPSPARLPTWRAARPSALALTLTRALTLTPTQP